LGGNSWKKEERTENVINLRGLERKKGDSTEKEQRRSNKKTGLRKFRGGGKNSPPSQTRLL